MGAPNLACILQVWSNKTHIQTEKSSWITVLVELSVEETKKFLRFRTYTVNMLYQVRLDVNTIPRYLCEFVLSISMLSIVSTGGFFVGFFFLDNNMYLHFDGLNVRKCDADQSFKESTSPCRLV